MNKNSNKVLLIAVLAIIALLYLIAKSPNSDSEKEVSVKGNPTAHKIEYPAETKISDFDYTLNENNVCLDSYKGHDDTVIINSQYEIDGAVYTVTEIGDSIFNGSDITKLFIPKTITTVYDNTLAYLSSDHIDLYYEGSEEEWNNVFKQYTPSSFSDEIDNNDYEAAGKALADKLNADIGHEFDPDKFSIYYNIQIGDFQ